MFTGLNIRCPKMIAVHLQGIPARSSDKEEVDEMLMKQTLYQVN